MYCRFCGKIIQDDSDFCAYCGKAQCSQPFNTPVVSKPHFGINIATLETIASICFYVGIIGFLILYIKMAPGIGGTKFLWYIVGAAVVIVAAVIVHKIRDLEYTHQRQLVALFFGLLLLIPSLALRVVYECKVDAATADIPKSGTVCVQIRITEEFYSLSGGIVRDPYAKLTIDGHVTQGTTLCLELNKSYPATIQAGYSGAAGYGTSSASGREDIKITLTQDNLQGGYILTEHVSLSSGTAKMTMTFTRICTFWEVILYTPS